MRAGRGGVRRGGWGTPEQPGSARWGETRGASGVGAQSPGADRSGAETHCKQHGSGRKPRREIKLEAVEAHDSTRGAWLYYD